MSWKLHACATALSPPNSRGKADREIDMSTDTEVRMMGSMVQLRRWSLCAMAR